MKQDPRFLFFAAYLGLILAGFFFIPTEPHRNLMYVGGILGTILLFVPFSTSPRCYALPSEQCRRVLRQPLFIAVGLLISYLTISVLWSSVDSSARILKFTKIIFILGGFCFLYMSALYRRPETYQFLLKCFIWAALISALLMLPYTMLSLEEGQKMKIYGLGRAENPVMFGLFTGMATLFLAFPDPDFSGVLKNKYVRWCGLVLLFVAFVFSLSRGPQLAFVVTACAVLVLQRRYRLIGVIIGAGVIFLGVMYFADFTNSNFFERGTSGRLDVWKQALALIHEKVLFGHGAATKHIYNLKYMGREHTVGHAHSLYLSVAVKGGVIALCLLIVSYVMAGWRAARLAWHDNVFSPGIAISMGAVLGLTDFGGLQTNLGATWLIFWLPVCYLLIFPCGEKVHPSV